MSQGKIATFACSLVMVLAVVSSLRAATKVGKYAYVSENGQVAVYAFDPSTGRLRQIQAVSYEGFGFISVEPSGKFAYIPTSSSTSASPLYGYKINSNGTLTALAGFPISVSATTVTFTPNGKFIYTSNYLTNGVEEYSVNATTGALTSIGSVATGSDASSIAITPTGKFAYVDNDENDSLSGFSINPTTGELTPLAGSPFATGTSEPTESDVISPNGKFLFAYSFDGSTAVFTIDTSTGALTLIPGSPFSGPPNDGESNTIDPTGHFYYAATGTSAGFAAYSVNQTTGALTQVSGSPYLAGSYPIGVTVDPSGKYLYVAVSANESPLYVFSIDGTNGTLTETLSEGLVGQEAGQLSFTSSTAAVEYTPTFAYVTNSGSKSIAKLNIEAGGLTVLGTVADSNGPQVSVASPAGTFLYTGNSNGSISEYLIAKATGALTKIKGSPITELTNPAGLAISPFYGVLYAEDPTAESTFDYNINAKTGALSIFFSGSTDGNGPEAIAVDPFGAFTLIVNNTSDQVAVAIPGTGFVNTVATGSGPVAITIDPSSQFVYVANSGDGTVSGYNLTLASPYMTPISGSPYGAGTNPSALVAEPYGRYLYVANAGSDSISAYSIDPLTGVLSPISGTFSTSGSPSALSVSIDGKYLYATDKDVSELDQFTINSDGTLSAAGGAGVAGTAPTSITTIGTYK